MRDREISLISYLILSYRKRLTRRRPRVCSARAPPEVPGVVVEHRQGRGEMFVAMLLQPLGFATHISSSGGRLGVQCDHLSGRSSHTLSCIAADDNDDAASNIRPASACWVKEQSTEMLQRFGSAFEDAEDKQYAFENLLLSRSQDALLDAALLEVATTSGSRLATRRYPLQLPSKRATVGCFGRLLAEMDDPCSCMEEGCEVGEGCAVSGLSRSKPKAFKSIQEPSEISRAEARRRQLLLLFRWCTYGRGEELQSGGVWKLEGEVLAETGQRRIGQAYGSATSSLT